MSTHDRKIRNAWQEVCMLIKPNAVMTLGSSLDVSAITFESHARRFLNAVQRDARGRNWHTYELTNRPLAIGFIEEGANRPHMHLAVRVPKDSNLRAAFQMGKAHWEKIRRGGDYHFAFLDNGRAYARYITKHFHRPVTAEQTFIYTPTSKRFLPTWAEWGPPSPVSCLATTTDLLSAL